MTIKSAYGKKSRVHATKSTGPGAKQSFKKECDINAIMAKYQKTGLIDHFNNHKANYGFAPAIEYREALEKIRTAQEMFAELPSQVRKKFGNDPEQFLAFTQDPSNRSEMAVLGLLNKDYKSSESPPAQPSDSATAPTPPSPATSANPLTPE